MVIIIRGNPILRLSFGWLRVKFVVDESRGASRFWDSKILANKIRMISYRQANNDDAISIAHLHAKSWQDHYRGIWSDTYLDSDVVTDRIKVWKNRFSIHNSKQLTVLAEYQNSMVGFACTFLDYEIEGEALLDNIHVYRKWQGKGIGKKLFKLSHDWVFKKNNQTILFLWVLTENNTAIRFYEKLGGSRTEISKYCNPDGSWSDVYKYVWKRND